MGYIAENGSRKIPGRLRRIEGRVPGAPAVDRDAGAPRRRPHTDLSRYRGDGKAGNAIIRANRIRCMTEADTGKGMEDFRRPAKRRIDLD